MPITPLRGPYSMPIHNLDELAVAIDMLGE